MEIMAALNVLGSALWKWPIWPQKATKVIIAVKINKTCKKVLEDLFGDSAGWQAEYIALELAACCCSNSRE